MQKRQESLFGMAEMVGFIAFMAAVVLFAGNRPSSAQEPQSSYPLKEIQLIVPFAPAGGMDLFGRTVARVLNNEKIVSKRIQVVNMDGASGAIGIAEMVQRRKGDSYSLMVLSIHAHVTPAMMGTPYSYKHLTPIAKLYSEDLIVVVPAGSPLKNLNDLYELRKDVGRIKIGGASVGNSKHLVAAKFAQELGLDRQNLPTLHTPAVKRMLRFSVATLT